MAESKLFRLSELEESVREDFLDKRIDNLDDSDFEHIIDYVETALEMLGFDLKSHLEFDDYNRPDRCFIHAEFKSNYCSPEEIAVEFSSEYLTEIAEQLASEQNIEAYLCFRESYEPKFHDNKAKNDSALRYKYSLFFGRVEEWACAVIDTEYMRYSTGEAYEDMLFGEDGTPAD